VQASPLVKTIVVDEERWWLCHMPRVVKGVAADKALYVALLAEWTGELPAELRELYDDGDA
jgi:hypothetical protein